MCLRRELTLCPRFPLLSCQVRQHLQHKLYFAAEILMLSESLIPKHYRKRKTSVSVAQL